jgi:uncharacterized membrane protein YukC
MQGKLLGIMSIGFTVTGQLMIIYFAFVKYMKKKKQEYNEVVHQLFINCKKAYDSVRRDVFYIVLTESGFHLKILRLI